MASAPKRAYALSEEVSDGEPEAQFHPRVQGRGGPADRLRGQEPRRGRPRARPGREPAQELEDGPGRRGRPGLPRQGQRPGRRGGAAPPPRRVPAAPHGARDLKKSDGLLRQGVVVRYRFVEGHRQEFPTRLMCRVLGVSTGGYYEWRRRPASARQERGEALVAEIKSIHREVKARYGSPRIHAELMARGHSCCVNTVARLMSRAGVAARTKRKFRCPTDSSHDHPVAENVVDRQFEPEAPDRVRTADIT